jgi:Ca2+-binding RTX toxin-like protein
VVSEPGSSGLGAPTLIGLPPGYTALLAENDPAGKVNAVSLFDGPAGNALLVGNQANDTISAHGANDTLVGGTGNTLFFANYAADIYGGGNDTIITGQGNSRITTAAGARSVVYLGATASNLVSQGDDLVLCAGGPGANDTISALQQDTIFAASAGETTIITGNGPSVIIGNPGQLAIRGGPGNGTVVFAGAAS